MKIAKTLIIALTLILGTNLQAQTSETTGDIVDVAASSEALSTLVAAVKAAELVETLKGVGPFTVFAPTNDAFDALPEGTVATLLKPENKEKLTAILTYHVVSGNIKAADVLKAIKSNDGAFTFPTVMGDTLTASVEAGNVILTDGQGRKSTITNTDINTSNGVVHLIDTVVLPN